MEYNAARPRLLDERERRPAGARTIGARSRSSTATLGERGDRGTAGSAVDDTGSRRGDVPWNDPHGFPADGKTEIQFLFCNETTSRTRRSAARATSASTPSEIIANQIETYEWQYHWRNFRTVPQVLGQLGTTPTARRTSSSTCAGSSRCGSSTGARAELADTFRRIGITNPNPNGSDARVLRPAHEQVQRRDASAANQMVAAFHKAIIQQSLGRASVPDDLRQVLRRRDPAGHHPRQAVRDAGLGRPLADRQLRPNQARRVHRVVLTASATRRTTTSRRTRSTR